MYINDSSPHIILIGGGNGSGKTTIAMQLQEDTGVKYLGSDAIAAQLDPAEYHNIETQAARVFSTEFKAIIKTQASVIVESTLSGLTLKNHLIYAKKHGYRITIIYVFISSVELSLLRIATRVHAGGHDVPEAYVRRRFPRSRKNFWEVYRPLADHWELIYNSPNEDRFMAGVQNVAIAELVVNKDGPAEHMSIVDPALLESFLESFGGEL